MAVLKSKKNRAKRTSKKVYHHQFNNIPKDLLVEVVARVGSTSITDLFNVKLSCKELLEAASENYVYEHSTMKQLPYTIWNDNKVLRALLSRCKDSGNPEALFREGMFDFFSYKKPERGLEYLKKAADKGHDEAMYVFGIISLVCCGEQGRQKGLNLLSSLKKDRLSCRKEVKKILSSMWIKNCLGVGPNNSTKTCNKCAEKIRRSNRWVSHDDTAAEYEEGDNNFACYCKWDREATWFCDHLLMGLDPGYQVLVL